MVGMQKCLGFMVMRPYAILLCPARGTHKLRKTAVIRPDPTQFLQRKYGNLLFSVQNTSAQMLDPAKKGRKSSINTVCYVHDNEKHVKNGRIDELFWLTCVHRSDYDSAYKKRKCICTS